jgi:excisionase family DNA binding protein
MVGAQRTLRYPPACAAQLVSTMSAEHLAYNIGEACQVARVGRTAIYEAIRSGELRAVKRGRRTLILVDDLRRWLENLPAVAPKANPNDTRPSDTSALGGFESALSDSSSAPGLPARPRKGLA